MPIPTTEKPPFIPAPGVAQVEMLYIESGQHVENVYHVLKGDGSAAPTLTDLNAIAATFEGWEHGSAVAMRHDNTVLGKIVVRDLTTQDGPVIEHEPTTSVTGVQAIPPCPNNVTVAIKWSTAQRGRSFRGRTFHIGMCTAFVDKNQLLGATRNDFLTRYTALHDDVISLGAFKMVVVSKSHQKFWRDVALSTPILSASIDPDLDSQRRRLAGRGT